MTLRPLEKAIFGKNRQIKTLAKFSRSMVSTTSLSITECVVISDVTINVSSGCLSGCGINTQMFT